MPTCLNLLAPDGIVYVEFAQTLSGEQSMSLLETSQTVETADELELALKNLGTAWDIGTKTEIVSRTKRVMASQSEPLVRRTPG